MARTRDAHVHWKDVLQRWSSENQREQVHLDDLLGLLSENPEEWNGGKGSFLTKQMSLLGWKTKRSRQNGRIYYRASPNPRPLAKTEPELAPVSKESNNDLEELFDKIRELVSAREPEILDEIQTLREKNEELGRKNDNLTGELTKQSERCSRLKHQIKQLEQEKEKSVSPQPVEKPAGNNLAQRAHELQIETREQANTIKYLETKVSNLQRQIEILESNVVAKPGVVLNSGANQKSVKDLLTWFGLDLEKSRVIASGRNLNHDVEIEIEGDKIIRFVTLPGEAERRSYNEISLTDPAHSILGVLFPCRVYYTTLTNTSIVHACELLGKPLRLV